MPFGRESYQVIIFNSLPVILSLETSQEVSHNCSLYISIIPDEVKIPAASADKPAAISVNSIVEIIKIYLPAYVISPLYIIVPTIKPATPPMPKPKR